MPRRYPALEDAIREIAALLAEACLRYLTIAELGSAMIPTWESERQSTD